VFEILTADTKSRLLIAAERPRDEIHAAATDAGMINFRQAALVALAEGRTSVEEVTRCMPVRVPGLEG
jgi:type II secretory ATPase GspE/PulE/Tfp pilus assembly ATPase PilB-like protein